MILAYIIFFSWLSILQHERFVTGGFDLGIFDQVIWNTAHGRLMWHTNVGEPHNRLGLHFEPILIPISLLYHIWSDVRVLLVLKSVALALGAIPIYRLAKERLTAWAGAGFVAVYLLFPALEGANLFEFHTTMLATPLLAFAFYYVLHRRYKIFLGYAILAMACREDMALMVAMMGLSILLIHHDRIGWLIWLAGLVIFGLIYFVALPYFQNGYYEPGQLAFFQRYTDLGDSPRQIVINVLTQPQILLRHILAEPDRVRYLTHLTVPVAFLALLDVPTLLPALPIIALNVFTNSSATYALDRFHYSVTLVPFIVLATINGTDTLVTKLEQWRKLSPCFSLTTLMGLILTISLIYHVRFGHSPLSANFSLPEAQTRFTAAEEMFKMIPPDAPLSAQGSLNPHLSQRRIIYLFPRLADPKYKDPTVVPAEYVALDRIGNIYPATPAKYDQVIAEMLANNKYEVLFNRADYLLLRRRAEAKP